VLDAAVPDVLTYVRRAGDDRALIVVNFADRPIEARIETGDGAGWTAAASTHLVPARSVADGEPVRLGPLEAIVCVPARRDLP
jgi:hypothetical protein